MSAPAVIYLEPGAYRYNAAPGESQRLAFTQWVDTEVIERWLEALPDSANSGDIYARLRVSRNPPRNPRPWSSRLRVSSSFMRITAVLPLASMAVVENPRVKGVAPGAMPQYMELDARMR